MSTIPFVDLRAQHDEVREEIDAAWRSAVDESAFIGGPRVTRFEQAFAKFCGSAHAIAVASGTDALELGMRAMGVGPGQIVITVPNTFIATIEAVLQLGAVPRFVDIDSATYNMDPHLLRTYLETSCHRDAGGVLRERNSGLHVSTIIPVHLFGLPAAMQPIVELAQEFGLEVVEDACQAHGATYQFSDGHWVGAGTIGRLGCFSFYPGKNLGAMGEAGAIITNDPDIAASVRLLRDHGQRERYIHVSADGVNARMDAIQAAVLTIKLARLPAWNERRRQAAAWYGEALCSSGLTLPVEPSDARHVYHLYVVQVPDRDAVRDRLAKQGIGTGLHYPIPLHLQPALEHYHWGAGSFPHTERAAERILSLPMYPHISRDQVNEVARSLMQALT